MAYIDLYAATRVSDNYQNNTVVIYGLKHLLGICVRPYIGVVMSKPPSTPVHDLSRTLSALGNTFQMLKERLFALSEIADICWPVIHLGVNIYSIFAPPSRLK